MLSNPWRGQCSCPTQVLWRLRGTCTFPSPSQFLNCVNCVNCVILFPDILQYWQGCLNIQGNCHSLWWGDVGNHWDCGGPLICLARSGWIQRGCGTGSTNVNKITQFAVPAWLGDMKHYETTWMSRKDALLWSFGSARCQKRINACSCMRCKANNTSRLLPLHIVADHRRPIQIWMFLNDHECYWKYSIHLSLCSIYSKLRQQSMFSYRQCDRIHTHMHIHAQT